MKRRKVKRLTPAERKRLKKLLRTNVSIAAAARRFGITPAGARRYL